MYRPTLCIDMEHARLLFFERNVITISFRSSTASPPVKSKRQVADAAANEMCPRDYTPPPPFLFFSWWETPRRFSGLSSSSSHPYTRICVQRTHIPPRDGWMCRAMECKQASTVSPPHPPHPPFPVKELPLVLVLWVFIGKKLWQTYLVVSIFSFIIKGKK